MENALVIVGGIVVIMFIIYCWQAIQKRNRLWEQRHAEFEAFHSDVQGRIDAARKRTVL